MINSRIWSDFTIYCSHHLNTQQHSITVTPRTTYNHVANQRFFLKKKKIVPYSNIRTNVASKGSFSSNKNFSKKNTCFDTLTILASKNLSGSSSSQLLLFLMTTREMADYLLPKAPHGYNLLCDCTHHCCKKWGDRVYWTSFIISNILHQQE